MKVNLIVFQRLGIDQNYLKLIKTLLLNISIKIIGNIPYLADPVIADMC